LNRERRAVEAEMQQQAMVAIDSLRLDDEQLPHGVCLYDPDWHQGVIGLVASRIKDHVHRPVIAFAPGAENEIKGSARSIPGFHIRDALDAVAARHPGLLSRFGGHAMAAGLAIPQTHFEKFRDAFDEEVKRQISEDALRGKVWSDGELSDDELTLDVATVVREAGPWGQNFPEPLFDGVFDVISRNVVGERHVKLGLRQRGQKRLEAIGFQFAPDGLVPEWERIRAAYRLDINEYRGMRALQLVLEHVEPIA